MKTLADRLFNYVWMLIPLFLVVIVGLLLAACSTVRCVRPGVVDVHVAPECGVTCKINTALIFADPNSIVNAARDAIDKCEARRALCEAALKRAQDAGAIK